MSPLVNYRILIGLIFISIIINILTLTSPLFMLQVYDRVLASGSVPTLVGLAVLAFALYGFQALLDILRSRVLLRIGERFDRSYSRKVHDAVVRLPLLARMQGDGLQPLRDLDNVRNFLSGPGPTAIFDLPWIPLYLGICFIFHFWIGVTALAGAVILVALTVLTGLLSNKAIQQTTQLGITRNSLLEATRRNAEVVQAMGLSERLSSRWLEANSQYLLTNRHAGDVTGGLGSTSKAMRVLLQSAILGVGAYFVIKQEASAGIMIASSIMMGRALAPVDLAISQWKPFVMARQSWRRLANLLQKMPQAPDVMPLPAPSRELLAENLAIMPPGERKPNVVGIGFKIVAGDALGIIGPSGSGKSTVVRALVGVWTPTQGTVRIDGASLDHWNREALGAHIGYLPQGIELFDGTIAENISRFEEKPDPDAIVAAAVAAGVHGMILAFEKGYDTRIGDGGSGLSAGQRQRIGLARALYRDPFLVVLDEPNANLDAEGETAVIKAITAIRARGGIAIVVAHRPSAISVVDHLLVMENGRQRAFGRKEEVLQKVLKVATPVTKRPTVLRPIAESGKPGQEGSYVGGQ